MYVILRLNTISENVSVCDFLFLFPPRQSSKDASFLVRSKILMKWSELILKAFLNLFVAQGHRHEFVN